MSNNKSMDVNENVNILFERLEKFIQSKTVVGESIQVGDVTLIPIITTSFGLGSGGGDGTDPKGQSGYGGGAGIGAKITPTAMLVIKDGNVELLPISKSIGLEKLLEKVPDIVNKFDFKKKEKDIDIKEKEE